MLNNPQKYQKAEQTCSSTYQGSPYGNPYGNPYGRTGSNQESYQNQGTYEEFNFEDLFGFGRRTYETARPQRQAGDSQYICQAVDFINMGQYAYADRTLNSIVSGERNARWHYLSALANQGMGNTLLASERIDKAIQMEPGNMEYQKAKQNLHSTGQSYSAAGQDYQNYADSMNRFCMSMCAMHFFCMFCCH
jgi:molecular chaperone DnaJ